MRDLILRFSRPILRLLGRDERGAIGILVGVLLGSGVLLGMGALAIDVGMLYQERSELQNGADAAALAVAKSCALGACTEDEATGYADANASDVVSEVALVCGSDTGGVLSECPESTETLTDCPVRPDSGNFVDVYTSTERADGSTLLPPILARTLAGNSDYEGTTVGACARAAWGAPSSATTIALTISACEWDAAVGAVDDEGTGATFPPPGPYFPPNEPAISFDRVLKLHDAKTSGVGCPTEPSGADAPGAFGWTDGTSCSVTITSGTYGGNTGISGKACSDALKVAHTSRTPVFLPIYVKKATGTGTNVVYTLKGFAAFIVTGYHIPATKGGKPDPGGKADVGADWLNPALNCKGQEKCINGFFTQALVPGGGTIGGQDLGATIIALTG